MVEVGGFVCLCEVVYVVWLDGCVVWYVDFCVGCCGDYVDDVDWYVGMFLGMLIGKCGNCVVGCMVIVWWWFFV